MKHILLFIGVLFYTLTFSQNQYTLRYDDESETIMKNNILFSITTNQPITGIVYKKYQNGTYKIECEYKNGLKNGYFKTWFENGNKELERNYKNDLANGSSKIWYENGNISTEINYLNGQAYGYSKEWFENGQLKIEYFIENSQPSGLVKTWYESGSRRSEAMIKDGVELYHKCWNEDGNLKDCK